MVVNAGGHLERAARRLFPEAALRPLSPNAAVREALLAGAADAAVTDTLEAPGWLAGTNGIRAFGPYTRDWKAYWLPASASERAHDLDAWLLAREADGTLAALRARTLPESAREASAMPLVALGAAIEERLALMPFVAEAKRASGAPVRASAQEQAVQAAAVASVREAAARAGAPAPDDAAVRDFFSALIDGAREIQERTLADPPAPAPPADLEHSLRPALARISERIAWLLVQLPPARRGGREAGPRAPRGDRRRGRDARPHRARTAGASAPLGVSEHAVARPGRGRPPCAECDIASEFRPPETGPCGGAYPDSQRRSRGRSPAASSARRPRR